jgi:hypothetical protein
MGDDMLNSDSIAYCGLICDFCDENAGCSCKSENNCGKRLSKEGCYQYTCCTEKKISGCWECADFPCGKDMMAIHRIKNRAFVKCIKEDGLERFIGYLKTNKENGVVYHRTGVIGDYDLTTEDEVLEMLRFGKITGGKNT